MKRLSLFVSAVLLGMMMVTAGCDQTGSGVDWKVKIGDVIPDFSLKDLDGQTVSAESLRGRAYVLAVFGTWCPPCKEELVALESHVWQPLKESGVRVIGLNFGDEDAATIQKFMKNNGLTFMALVDEKGSLRRELGVDMVPQSVLVGPDGRIVDLHVGFTEDGIESVRQDLERLGKQLE